MNHPVDIHVGMRLRQFRHMRGMTLHEVAERVGVRSQQLHKYETAVNRVSASRMWELAAVLRIPISVLFPEDGATGTIHRADHGQVRLLSLYSQFSGVKQAALVEFAEALAEIGPIPGQTAPRAAGG